MDNIQKAWAAGLLDGEGSLSIKRTRRDNVIHYQLWVVCGMSDILPNRKALTELQSMFGGNIVFQKETKNPNRKNRVSWTVVSQMALNCLKKLRPYFRVKSEHAKLLIEFQESCISRKGKKKDPKKLSRQEDYFYRVRKLTTRGVLRLQRLSEVTTKVDATV